MWKKCTGGKDGAAILTLLFYTDELMSLQQHGFHT